MLVSPEKLRRLQHVHGGSLHVHKAKRQYFSCPQLIRIELDYTSQYICTNLFSSVSQSCPTLCNPMDWSMPGFPVHHQLLKLTQIHIHLNQWCHPTISFSLDPFSPLTFNLSHHQGLFQWVGSLPQVAKGLEFSFSISSTNEYSGQISFWMEWLDILASQGTLKSHLQHHSSKGSILRHSVSL